MKSSLNSAHWPADGRRCVANALIALRSANSDNEAHSTDRPVVKVFSILKVEVTVEIVPDQPLEFAEAPHLLVVWVVARELANRCGHDQKLCRAPRMTEEERRIIEVLDGLEADDDVERVVP